MLGASMAEADEDEEDDDEDDDDEEDDELGGARLVIQRDTGESCSSDNALVLADPTGYGDGETEWL